MDAEDQATVRKITKVAKKLLTEEDMTPAEMLAFLREEYDVSEQILFAVMEGAKKDGE